MNSLQEVLGLFSGASAEAISALGLFLARVRQARRKMKLRLEGMAKKLEAHSFAAKRAAWRLKSKKCCRHGVLFHTWPAAGCDCMNPHAGPLAWEAARYMPALDEDLKTIVAVPFHRDTFVHLAVLHHQARILGW